MNKLKTIILSTMMMAGLLAAPVVLTASTAQAATCTGTAVECAQQGAGTANTGGATDIKVLVKNIVNILLFIVGAVAVIMIIIGGLRYVISNGDSNQLTSAKNTILYAVIGLVVAILAYAIVNFVLGALT